MTNRALFGFLFGILLGSLLLRLNTSLIAAEPAGGDLFARKNLVAWCIVPFDSKKRGPEDRAAMLEKLGFSKFAYDYRAEHIPTFDAEIEALKRHHVELTAWWFPTVLNDEAKMTLAVFEKHKVTPQLWVTGGGAPTKSDAEQRQRVLDEAARIRPIAEAAGKIGCKVALYNHGGWFGEPENQIAIIRELNLPNVGIVYNQHHGHDHLERFPELLKLIKPYLLTLNLNGMVKNGDRQGQKILQLGQGNLDLKLLQIVMDSGYTGPIGIIGHTDDDAEERLRDNLDGLDWLRPQLNGKAAGAKPKTRTPIPAVPAAAVPKANLPRLAEGKFGKSLDGRSGGAFVTGREEFHQFPITVECWTKLSDKAPYNILIANELKSSGTHWELFTMAGTGNFTVYTPGFTPDHCHTTAMICNGQWHHVAMILEPERIRLFVDGQIVANQAVRRTAAASIAGDLSIGSLVDQAAGCTGLIDEVRISRGIRLIDGSPSKPFEPDETTLALWHLDGLKNDKQFDDATGKNAALVGQSTGNANSTAQKSTRIEGHWGEDALGFRWTEEDSRDDRFGQMDTGPFFSGSITGPGGIIYKGIVVRLGPQQTHSICYDTELMRASAGWKGFLKFDAARFGIIVPPRIEGDVTFTTPLLAGFTRGQEFDDHRKTHKFGPIDKSVAHYEGLYRHGKRVVLKFSIASPGQPPQTPSTEVFESPWIEEIDGATVLSRTLRVSPSRVPLSMLVAEANSLVRLADNSGPAKLERGPAHSHILVVPPHTEPITVKVIIASSTVGEAAFEKLATAAVTDDIFANLTKPGPAIWGEPLVTTGEVSKNSAPYVVDTITLPFENPFRALMFCGGHDFLPDGRAYVCTLHGDVWLVDGIDDTLKRITWRRFATGLFQPLGIKIIPRTAGRVGTTDVYVVGRDQITRLHDLNNDGEADFYENFNNDAYVSLNGHEYVTCLETDRAGNFYYLKGNCDSAIPHDGSVLRVSADGSKLDVYATGFRNANGMSIGPHDEITVSPQEGEWTPASAVFSVHQGGFYGAMMSHHRPTPPTDFERPFCWFPRLADNSCGGQVWVNSDRWGPLNGALLHLSYGQCKLRLLLMEEFTGDHKPVISGGATDKSLDEAISKINGGSTEFPLTFASGVHRGRFNPKDGQLYVTGLKGWVSSAVNDGCFQRVRYTGKPIDLLVGMKTYRNGIALTFTNPLRRDEAENVDNYELEAWNYRWSAEYGSPEFKPSGTGQIGRDTVEPKSATLLPDHRTVFLELPDLKPVDQMGVSYTLRSEQGGTLEQTAYLTLNGISQERLADDQLHRPTQDAEKNALLSRLTPGIQLSAPFATGLTTPTTSPTLSNSRLIAWTDAGSPGGPHERMAMGYLKVPFTGEYRFNLEVSDHPEGVTLPLARLEINEATYEFGGSDVVVRLRKGFNRFRLHHQSSQPSRVRLMWETDRFPRELIPATALFHDDPRADHVEQRTVGHTLYSRHQCGRCHIQDSDRPVDDGLDTIAERLRQAPRLDGIGSRLDPHWLATWLRNPTHVRPHATMPSLLESQNDAALSDLVAYLASLRDPLNEPHQQTRPNPDNSRSELGAEVYERLGCMACHTLKPFDSNSEWNRLSLFFVKAKFQPGQLERFLRQPHRYHLGSHMPDFHLSEDEAGQLAVYLQVHSEGSIEPNKNLTTGHPDRGKKLFAELRCNHCHQITESINLSPPDVRSVFVLKPEQGCLRSDADKLPTAPRFHWTDHERNALKTYLAETAIGKADPVSANQPHLQQMLASLRCTACHGRDATSARWPEIAADEGSGKLPEAVPQLTWVGEKLQGPWIAKLLKGEVRHKPRPWLKARMPSFPAYADSLAQAFARQHGVPFQETVPTEFDSRLVETGQKLTLRDGGLDCRQCHAVGNEQPRGDAATQIALGINFAFTRDRLRPEFALRQILDPPRYDLGSRMPRFAPDLQTTAVKQIEGGNARKQFQAIKQYLWSLKIED